MPNPAGPPGYGTVRHAYDTVAEDYAACFPDTRAEAPLDMAMVDAFADAVADEAGGPVLDAGCGPGRMSRYLADRGCEVEGVDLSPGMVAAARRARPDLRYAVASLAALPYPPDRFAGVLLWYSTIHTPPSAVPLLLAEATRVLRPGGHLLVGFQSGVGTQDVSGIYRELGHDVVLERHLFTPDQVAGWLGDLGLREVARTVRRPRPGERDDQAAVLARLVGPAGPVTY